MNAESILWHTVQQHSLKNRDLNLRGVRVRATGYTVDEGLDLDYFTRLRFFKDGSSVESGAYAVNKYRHGQWASSN